MFNPFPTASPHPHLQTMKDYNSLFYCSNFLQAQERVYLFSFKATRSSNYCKCSCRVISATGLNQGLGRACAGCCSQCLSCPSCGFLSLVESFVITPLKDIELFLVYGTQRSQAVGSVSRKEFWGSFWVCPGFFKLTALRFALMPERVEISTARA